MLSFWEFINETVHKQDPTGYKPAPWENRLVKRYRDGKEGKIGEPIGDAQKQVKKYRIYLNDGEEEVLSIAAIRKQYEFYRENL
jgi:hypothetical protein